MPPTADRLSRALAARGIHYGWVMAALSFFYITFSSSAMGVPAVLILPMAQDLGWSIGELSAPQGLRLALFGLAAPLAGGLMLRYGPQRMVLISGLALLAGLLLSIFTTQKWQLWLGQGVLLGIAPGLTAMQLSSVVPTRWFLARRGLVLGLLSGAIATGTLVFMPLAAWVSQQWSWRVALLIPTLGCLLSWLLLLWLGRDRPADLGLPPLGETQVQAAPPALKGNFVQLSLHALSTASRRWVFWVLVLSFGICGATSMGLTQTHLVPFCSDLGLPLGLSASLLALIGVCDLIGTVGSGWLCDRLDNRWLLAWYYLLRGVALMWLVRGEPGLFGLMVFGIVYGLDYIATVPPTVRLTVQAYGRELGPAVFAWIFAAHQIAAGLMALGTGISRDAVGSYVPAFALAALLCGLAAASFAALRPRHLAPG